MCSIWNYDYLIHVGANRGVPNELMRNNNAALIDPRLLPDRDDAVQRFESFGGHLTLFSPFGYDPLEDRPDLISQRETEFYRRYPDFGPFFYTVVNGDYLLFHQGLLFLIDISKCLESCL